MQPEVQRGGIPRPIGRRAARSRFRIGIYALLGVAAAALCGCESDTHESGSSRTISLDLSCPDSALSPTPLRRLTRFEYANAVRDVFGIELPFEDLFPRDEVSLGFDDQAGTLTLSDLHVQGYFDAASTVADWVSSDASQIERLAGCAGTNEDCARSLLANLTRKLERREASSADVERGLALFDGDYSPEHFGEGVYRVLATMLQSPRFVYRFERAADASALREPASPWLLAARLAWLFWGSVPDDALLDAAAHGELSTAADVEREARRLLADPRARRGISHFYVQWLGLTDFDDVEKDRRAFPLWDDTLKADMVRETLRFVEGVLWEDDARWRTLLTGRYSFADAVLASFYGLPVVDPDQTALERVEFPPGSDRIGLLTQASILSRQAKANQTDPIHRGKFIREQFFCTTPPPPPPDLVVSPPAIDVRKTTRERFAEHRANPACAGCHELLDATGFLFEHYDAIGHYREREGDQPIDATGYLAGTDITGTLDGVEALSEALSESSDAKRCMIKQWFRYTFSRGETEADACTLAKLEQVFEQSDGDLAELLIALTQTDPFLYATPAPEPDEEEP